jgi:hypothetical protein
LFHLKNRLKTRVAFLELLDKAISPKAMSGYRLVVSKTT